MASTIGIDLGGTKLAAARVAFDGTIEARLAVPTPRDPEAVATEPVRLAAQLMGPGVVAVGMGAPGLVTWPEGTLVWGPNVVGVDVPYRKLLENEFGLRAVVDNDANLAALAEHRRGAGRGASHMLMLTLGTGIGGGLIVDGDIYRGASFAGEIGHMTVVVDGPACRCGRQGCWEQLASGRALARLARQAQRIDPSGAIAAAAGDEVARGEHVTRAARQGDPDAMGFLADMGRWLGLGIANLIAALDPDVVVIGGGLSDAGDLVLDPAREAAGAFRYGAGHRPEVPIARAVLGEEAGMLGAALIAAEATRG